MNIDADLGLVLPRSKYDRPALWHCLDRVHDQIKQDLLQLLWVALQSRKTRLDVLPQFQSTCTARVPRENHYRVKQVIHFHHSQVRLSRFREVEKAGEQSVEPATL